MPPSLPPALPPSPEAESVWEYPRPPSVRRRSVEVEIIFAGVSIARTDDVVQILETSHPPTYYLPEGAFIPGVLTPVDGSTWCEFKGAATYFDVEGATLRAPRAAWTYRHPAAGYEALLGRVAVMPAPMDRCLVGGVVVRPQDGGFYGGWITPELIGPFKGSPGTLGW